VHTATTTRYLAFSHVHTTTPGINQTGPGAQFEQYAGCPFVGASARGRFGDALLEVDWLVGGLVAQLEKLRVLDNTLLLFTSDNG
jgi:arylsulfatase